MSLVTKGTKGLTPRQAKFATGLAGAVSKTVNPTNRGLRRK